MRVRRRERGSLLIEAIASIAIFGLLLASAFRYASERADDLKDQSAAQYHIQVLNAAKKYLLDNYAAVLSASTATVPAVITVGMLQNTGYLPNSFQPANSYSQAPCVLALQPSSNQIQALVVSEGGSAIPSRRTPGVAALIGASGGYIPSGSPASAQGAFGGWQLATANFVSRNCSGTAAGPDRLAAAIFFDAGNVSPEFVYRGAVPGHPEFNSMTTPLAMKAVVAAGTSDGLCVTGNISTYGRIAVDSSGAVMSCQLGVWQKQTGSWKDPVADFASLPAGNNTLGDVRLTTDYGRAYSWNGTTWIPLAVDQNGNFTLPGTVTFNQAQVNGVVIAGATCSSTGLVARDSNGLLLSCQFGTWKKQGGGSIFSASAADFRGMETITQYDGNCGCSAKYVVDASNNLSYVRWLWWMGVWSAAVSCTLNTINCNAGSNYFLLNNEGVWITNSNFSLYAGGYVTGVAFWPWK